MPEPTVTTAPIRLGVHGSPQLATGIVRAAGHDERTVRLVPYDVADPFHALRAGETDVMIVKYGLREPDLAVGGPVGHDPRAVLVGAHHPLAERREVSLEELAAYDAFHCPGSFPEYVWDKVVPRRTPSGRPIRRTHHMGSVEQLMALLAGTDAIHISFRSLEHIAPPAVRVIPVRDLPPAPVALAWLRDPAPSPELAAFITAAEAGSATR
ncbi:LysR substrate-binding domain-containing protein [Streptomyces sp.]|uniref:LysR substrate-binding domain-containing protein n=1 Tax=Streptomyces sp. TaxID=1931 RepID=UPI002D25FC2D|nr:LysR substrate-binding domain-containing protein [Streptomyces sp.]HZF89909.1 LysR substrate-binding domain-containing protein [Streptomyces sp.]